MKRVVAEHIIREHGPCKPEEINKHYTSAVGKKPTAEQWAEAMRVHPELVKDNSGKFHIAKEIKTC